MFCHSAPLPNPCIKPLSSDRCQKPGSAADLQSFDLWLMQVSSIQTCRLGRGASASRAASRTCLEFCGRWASCGRRSWVSQRCERQDSRGSRNENACLKPGRSKDNNKRRLSRVRLSLAAVIPNVAAADPSFLEWCCALSCRRISCQNAGQRNKMVVVIKEKQKRAGLLASQPHL